MTRTWKQLMLAAATGAAIASSTPLKASPTPPTTRPVDAIIRDFNAANFNAVLALPPEQRQPKIKEIRARRDTLALEMLRTAPQDPRLADVMRDRWMSMSSNDDPTLTAELDHIIATSTNTPLVNQARISKVNDASLQLANHHIDLPTAQKVYDDYLAKPENDEYAVGVMTEMAQFYPVDRQIEIYKQLLAKYPKADEAPMAAVKLHTLTAIGKFFPLSFDDAITGRHIDTKDLAGKVVVLDFWATWCHPCVELIPHLKAMYDRDHAKGLEIVGVSLDRSPAEGGLTKLKTFVADHQLPWPQDYEGKFWGNELAKTWGVIGIPQVFVLDREGRLVSTEARFTVEDEVERLLKTDAAPQASLSPAR